MSNKQGVNKKKPKKIGTDCNTTLNQKLSYENLEKTIRGQKELAQKQKEIKSLKLENEKLNEQFDDLKASNSDLIQQTENLKQELSEANQKYTDLESGELKETKEQADL